MGFDLKQPGYEDLTKADLTVHCDETTAGGASSVRPSSIVAAIAPHSEWVLRVQWLKH